MSWIIGWTERESRLTLALASLLLVLAIWAVQHATPFGVSYTAIFLLTTGAMTWLGGPIPGLVAAVASAGLVLFEECLWGSTLYPVWIACFNFLTRFGSYSGVVWIVEGWRRSTRELERRVTARTAELRRQIAQHQETEVRLRDSMERFSQLAENISEAFWLSLPVSKKIVYVSPGYEKIWGRPCASLYASPRSWLEAIHPEDQPRVAQALPGQIVGSYDEEYRIVRPDGTQRWIRDRAFPIRNEKDEVIRMAGIAEDITNRKLSEAQLAEALDLNRKMIAASSLGIAAYRGSGPCIFANEALASLIGVRVEQVLGHNFRQIDSWKQSGLLDLALEALSENRARAGEIHMSTTTGKRLWLDFHVTTFVSGGEPHLLVMVGDVTERKRAALLLELQRDISRVLGTMNDLHPALDYLLEVTTHLEGVDCGGVYLVDDRTGDLALVAHRGVSTEFIPRISYFAANSAEALLAGRDRPIYGRPRELYQAMAAVCEAEGIKALGILPMREESQLIMVLVVGTHKQEDIPASTRLIIETIATQAQGALARIRAEEGRRQTEARLRTLISGAPIVVFAVDHNRIITFEEGRALSALDALPGQNVGRSVDEVYSQSPQILQNARRALAGEEFRALAEFSGKTFDCQYSPVFDPSGRCSGYIGVATDITERVRLEREILEVSDREQARLGQDIHDGLCQQLVSVAFDANSLAQELAEQPLPQAKLAERIALLLDEAITDCRRLARGLYPVKLEAEGLASALEELAATTRSRSGIDCDVRTPSRFTPKDHATATHLYRIAQEALNNAVKHSGARHVLIQLTTSEQMLRLEVSDDGQGIAEAADASAGMGLHIMDYRARTIGGQITVTAQPGGGTLVSCCVPLERI
jgi:PAS domain S-box-containing protein